ncbi:MAG: hypothetical protein K2I01_07775 [Lachnospiraceae bacterium]|nr:hypothetical protein [Lachnospiraceae bacterium]
MKASESKKTNYKKHCILFAALSLPALLAAAMLVIAADPFFQYHKPLKGLYYLIDNKLSQNPGLARHFEYDSIITGSSMTVNFDTALFAEELGLNTIKLSYDGAYPKDIDTILSLVRKSPNEIRAVFLSIDILNYRAEAGVTAYELPAYLYSDTVLDDIPYLLNKEVILDYIVRPQIEREGTPLNEAYWSWIYMWYGKDIVFQTYEAPSDLQPALPKDAFADRVAANLEAYILPHIESMPDTEFTFFFPPYSVLYWYNRYADGSLAAELAAEKQVIEALLAYPNVKIYYFQDDFDYITNFDNYCDYTHYRHEMNDYMTECFAGDSCRLSLENYNTVLDNMLSWAQSCDYQSYLP